MIRRHLLPPSNTRPPVPAVPARAPCSWAGAACTSPIFAEVVPSQLRSLVYSFDRAFEGGTRPLAASALGACLQERLPCGLSTCLAPALPNTVLAGLCVPCAARQHRQPHSLLLPLAHRHPARRCGGRLRRAGRGLAGGASGLQQRGGRRRADGCAAGTGAGRRHCHLHRRALGPLLPAVLW